MIRAAVLKWLPEKLARVASIATSSGEQTVPWTEPWPGEWGIITLAMGHGPLSPPQQPTWALHSSQLTNQRAGLSLPWLLSRDGTIALDGTWTNRTSNESRRDNWCRDWGRLITQTLTSLSANQSSSFNPTDQSAGRIVTQDCGSSLRLSHLCQGPTKYYCLPFRT